MSGRAGAAFRVPGPIRAVVCLLTVVALAGCDGGPGEGEDAGGSTDAPGAASSSATAGTPSAGSAEAAGAAQDTQRIDISELGVNTGAPGAPIQVVEFSDFGCPHCREFHEEVYPVLYKEYVETGKVIWKYVPFVLGTFPNSLAATRAGQCAIEQSEFAPMRDRLFEHQRDWMTTSDPTPLFLGYAREAGLDVERFRSCFDEGRREERIQQTLAAGRRADIQGTPTFFIQGQKVEGNRPAEFFHEVFDRMLEEQGTTDGGGPAS